MRIKRLLIAVISISVAGSAIAQDKIFKSDGEVLDVKIRSVERKMINFVRYDNPSGPEYTIPKNEVDKIKYQNGSEETFTSDRMPRDRDRDMEPRRFDKARYKNYKPNIVAFAPVQMSENGAAGFSLSYERAIDKKSIVAFSIPAMAVFNPQNNTYYNGTTANSNDLMLYLAPGLKLYPTGGLGIAKYAVGPSLVIADGQKTSTDYYGSPTPQDHFEFGIMLNQSININPTPHLYIGSEFGFGFTYINKLAGVEQGTTGLVQFSFKVGYRF